MIGTKYCPQCDSEDVSPIVAGDTEVWMCHECGHSSSEFPERKANSAHFGDEDDEISDYDESGEESFDGEEHKSKKSGKGKEKKISKMAKSKKAKKKGGKK